MKTALLVAAALALAGACSSSTSDRPTTQDERRAEIEQDQERIASESRASAEAAHRDDLADESDTTAAQSASSSADRPDTWAEADAKRAGDANDADGDRVVVGDDATDGAESHNADNTGRNKRDDEPGKLTALDQSNSASDVDITQAIRKKVVADDALSFNAKNVKIITVSGKVTLRGPVESAQESTSIEKSARAVKGVVAVDNQIEVKR